MDDAREWGFDFAFAKSEKNKGSHYSTLKTMKEVHLTCLLCLYPTHYLSFCYLVDWKYPHALSTGCAQIWSQSRWWSAHGCLPFAILFMLVKDFGFGCTKNFLSLSCALVLQTVSKLKFVWISLTCSHRYRKSTTSRCGAQPCHQAQAQTIANAVPSGFTSNSNCGWFDTEWCQIFNIPSRSPRCDCRRNCGCLRFYDRPYRP